MRIPSWEVGVSPESFAGLEPLKGSVCLLSHRGVGGGGRGPGLHLAAVALPATQEEEHLSSSGGRAWETPK